MRAVIPLVILAMFLIWLYWFVRQSSKDERYENRTNMIKDDNYIALESSIHLMKRMIEYDDIMPGLHPKHKQEADQMITDFNQRQLRKGKT